MLLTVLLAFLAGCDKGKSTNPIASNLPGASVLYVLNSTGSSLSAINLDANAVTVQAATLETWPNQVVYSAGTLYAVNSGTATVQIFNADDYSSLGKIQVGSNTNPMCIAVTETKAYITCLLTDEVRVANLATRSIVKSIPVGHAPTGIIVLNNRAYVTNVNTTIVGTTVTYGPGSVSVIDCTSDMVVDSVHVGVDPQTLAAGPDGNVHVVCTGDYGSIGGVVSVINPTVDTVVATIAVGGVPGSIAFSSAGIGYLGSSFGTGVMRYNPATYAIIDPVSQPLISTGGAALAADAHGNIYVAAFASDQVYRVDANGTVVGTFTVGDGPLSMAIK